VTRRVSWLPSAGLLATLGLLGCSTTTKSVYAPEGAAMYSVECVHVHQCWAAARRACGGGYQTLSTTENRIPESELPGLNRLTVAHADHHSGMTSATPSTVPVGGPGIESDAPMPFTRVVVACTGV
jgi:hypothetical protein